MPGGNSHQRAVAKTAQAKIGKPAPTTPIREPIASQNQHRSIGELIWSWPVVGGSLFFIWGGGIAFMTSSHRVLADVFYLLGAALFLAKFLTWEPNKTRNVLGFGIAGTVLLSAVAVWGNHALNPIHITPTASTPPDVKYPPPKGPGQEMQARVEIPSSQLCVNMSDPAQIDCLCPRPLPYTLEALPAPTNHNYATKITINTTREPIYKLRIFSRTPIYSGQINAFPYGAGQAAVAVEEFDYDRLSLVMQSSRPEQGFTIEVDSAQGLRLKCINQEN